MPLFRLYQGGESSVVGVVVACNKQVASAFAQGKYGAGAFAERVDWKPVLESGGVCEVVETSVKHQGTSIFRVIV